MQKEGPEVLQDVTSGDVVFKKKHSTVVVAALLNSFLRHLFQNNKYFLRNLKSLYAVYFIKGPVMHFLTMDN